MTVHLTPVKMEVLVQMVLTDLNVCVFLGILEIHVKQVRFKIITF